MSRALDLIKPGPRLFPVNTADRVRVEDAEQRGEELQNAVRRLFDCAMKRIRGSAIDRLAARRHGATDAAARRDLAELPQRLNQIEAWIEASRVPAEPAMGSGIGPANRSQLRGPNSMGN